MAISRKGSRKIVVDDVEFRWRATGNDDFISIVVWPADNESSRLIGDIRYHQKRVEASNGGYTLTNQIVITNRIIRRLILHYGVERLVESSSQINAGPIDDVIEIGDSLHADD